MLEYPWEILRKRVERLQVRRPLAGHMLFVIQHVLDDLAELITAFVNLGCLPEDITVIGIPYSSRQNAAEVIRSLGCDRVFLPTIFPMDGIVANLLLQDIQKAT